MSSSGIAKLLRFRRAVPLPQLNQGSTLSVRTTLPNVSLRVQSGWRDDGHATFLQQHFPTSSSTSHQQQVVLADLKVRQENDQVTSLGRTESHLSLWLEPATSDSEKKTTKNNPTIDSREDDDDNNNNNEWDADPDSHYTLTVQVPEKVNLTCHLEQGGNIHVANKIEGDVRLSTTNGSIAAKKLRGHTIELESNHTIYSSDLLEAQNLRINLHGGRLRAKRIHGDAVDVKVNLPTEGSYHPNASQSLDDDDDDDLGSIVDISSMYVSGTGGAQIVLEAGLQPEKRGVRIKSHHGPVVVTADGVGKPTAPECPLVELGSVNGSCEVSVRGTIMPESSDDWTACQVHYDSIAPESVSLICIETGNVGLTLDRKLEADIRLLSCTDTTTLGEKSSLLAEDDDSQQVLRILFGLDDAGATTAVNTTRISVQTQAFTKSISFVSNDNQTEYVEGWVENKSHEPDSRFEMKTRGEEAVHSVGKIRLEGAANQALKNFSSPQFLSTSSTRPLIVAASGGRVTVETLSWLGAIARRYGLDEKGRELGRQATRRGRVVVPADE